MAWSFSTTPRLHQSYPNSSKAGRTNASTWTESGRPATEKLSSARPAAVRREEIGIKGGKMAVEEVITTRHGPVINALFKDAFPAAPPLALPPVEIDGHLLVDGGLVNPVPVSMCRAMGAEVVIAVMGELDNMAGEAASRASLDLPGRQQELLEAVVALGKPVVLVLLNGRPLSINWAAEHVPAILEAWEPGSEGGHAVADVLFGDVNPGGKLPVRGLFRVTCRVVASAVMVNLRRIHRYLCAQSKPGAPEKLSAKDKNAADPSSQASFWAAFRARLAVLSPLDGRWSAWFGF